MPDDPNIAPDINSHTAPGNARQDRELEKLLLRVKKLEDWRIEISRMLEERDLH